MSARPTSPSDTLSLRTGGQMPVLGLGTWQLTDDTAGTVHTAIGLGYRLIDTSGDDGTQPGIAEARVELWRELQRARDEGLTRDIGVSNYSIEQMEEIAEASGEVPAVNQIEWSPFGWSQHMLEHYSALGPSLRYT